MSETIFLKVTPSYKDEKLKGGIKIYPKSTRWLCNFLFKSPCQGCVSRLDSQSWKRFTFIQPRFLMNTRPRPPAVSPSQLSPRPTNPIWKLLGLGGAAEGCRAVARQMRLSSSRFGQETGERVRALINNHVVSLPPSLSQSRHQTRVGE